MNTNFDRDKKVRSILIVEGCANLVVLLLKLVVGISTNSLAIIGDAIHSLTDVLNNVVVYFVTRHSQLPPDKNHPYGHKKFETLAVFGLATLLSVLGFELGLAAIRRGSVPIKTGNWEIAFMVIVLVFNITLSLWEKNWAKKLNSSILDADAKHTLTDSLTTFVIIISWQFSAQGYFWLDKVCTLFVSLLIFYLAYGLFKQAVPVLVDSTSVDVLDVKKSIQLINGVEDVGRVRTRQTEDGHFADVTIFVVPHMPTHTAHEIADQIETLLHQKFGIFDVSVHIEPKV